MEMSRRAFCVSAIGAGTAFGLVGAQAASAQRSSKIKFYKNLGPGHIGVRANQEQAVKYAAQYGFDSITPSAGPFLDKSAGDIEQWLGQMRKSGIRYGSAGLPVDFRRDEDRYQQGLGQMPKQARVLKQLGVTRMATWILPGDSEMTYLKNFERHRRRLRAASQVLQDNGIRLGLEFVGPRTSRARKRFPFICTQHGMMELIEAIG